ncbi:hypothetical protein GOP47_0022647, partial [Adiantum capillus-veneris]
LVVNLSCSTTFPIYLSCLTGKCLCRNGPGHDRAPNMETITSSSWRQSWSTHDQW